MEKNDASLSNIKRRYSLCGWSFKDYIDFGLSIGPVWAVSLTTLLLTLYAWFKGINIPQQVYSIPIGFLLFSIAYWFDGISHRTIFKNVIDRAELGVHMFMVFFSAFPLFIFYILAYWFPSFCLPFIFALLFLKIMYSLIDEARYHWRRYESGRSDVIEMVAHYFQWVGNLLQNFGFLYLIYWNKYEVIKILFN